MKLFLLYRDALLRSLSAFVSGRLNVSMDFKLIFFKAPPASYLASLFAYKLGTGLDLNRIVRPFLRSFRRRYPLLKGVRLVCSGRFSRKQRAQHTILFEGVVPTNTLRAKLDYSVMTSRLKYGACSIKIWLNFR
jgi:ribosomal protein S3